MKKNLIILLVTALALLLLGCQSDTSIYVGDDISVALIIGQKGDMSFNDAAVVGLNMAKEDYDINLSILEHQNNPEKFELSLVEAAENGNDIIMGSSFLAETIEKNAEKYPDISFVLYDGEIDWTKGNYNNVVCITYESNQASFLAGYAAASLSKSETIGVLAGMDLAMNNDFIVGYIEGALLYNPNIKVAVEYVGSFADAKQGELLAKNMIDQGVDVLFNVAGGSGKGLFKAVVEEGIMAIGVDIDQATAFEFKGEKDLAASIFTSVLKRVDHSLYEAVGLYQDQGLRYGQTIRLGLKEEAVGLAKNTYYNQYLDQEVRSAIDELSQKIISEEIMVDSALGKEETFLKELKDSVRP